MSHTRLNDPAFDRRITLRDAYRIMERFSRDHLNRGETSTVEFVSYFALAANDESGDPGALDDYLSAARAVMGSGWLAQESTPSSDRRLHN